MRNRPFGGAVPLALLLAGVLAGCDNKSSPTEPPPTGGPAITAASGASVALPGTWRSRCFSAPAGSPVAALQETFTITAAEITLSIAGFSAANCTGVSVAEELIVDYALGAESTATLAGRSVSVTRIDGAVQSTSDPFRQVFHIDDRGSLLLYHGVLEGGPIDVDGYPTELFEEPLERQ